MNSEHATRLLRTLTEGMDPFTRRPLADDDLCRHPDIRRTLLAAIVALEQVDRREERDHLTLLHQIAAAHGGGGERRARSMRGETWIDVP